MEVVCLFVLAGYEFATDGQWAQIGEPKVHKHLLLDELQYLQIFAIKMKRSMKTFKEYGSLFVLTWYLFAAGHRQALSHI